MPHDPRRLLRDLRDDFRLAAAHLDARYVEVMVDKRPLLRPSGRVSWQVLRLISQAIYEDREEPPLARCNWSIPGGKRWRCHRPYWLVPKGTSKQFMQALRDYSFATMLCLVEIAPAREAFAITAHKDDFDLLVAEAWVDILISLADRDEHPVLRMDHDHIHVWKHDRKTKSYRLYAGMYHLDLPSLSAPRYSRQTLSIIRSNDNSDQDPDEDPASLLARLKSLGESETSVREMACGLLRGSAYAIDWILEEYGG